MRHHRTAALAVAGFTAAALLAGPSPARAASGSVSFTTRGCSTWTVPAGVTAVDAVAVGAAGRFRGGRGDLVSATLTVAAGTDLRVCVDVGGGSGSSSGEGGGASGVASGTDFSRPLIVAGGGGGSAYGDGTTYFSTRVPGYDAGYPSPTQPSTVANPGAASTAAGPGTGGAGSSGFAQQGDPFILEDGFFFTAVSGGGGGGGYRGGDGGAGIAFSPFSGIFLPGGGGSDYCGADRPDAVLNCTVQAGAGTAFGAVAQGGSARVTLSWATTPVVSLTADRAPDAVTWYRAPVTFTVSSDVAADTCDTPVTYSGPDSTGATVTGTCTDAGGLVGTGSATLRYDATPPHLDVSGGPVDGASYVVGSVPAAPTCTASDATSGVATDCTVTGYATGLGAHSLSFTATDVAGNTARRTVAYTVTGSSPTLTGTPPGGRVGDGYAFAFSVGGVPAPAVALDSGSLPAGLILTADGRLSGTPTTPGSSTFTVRAANAVGSLIGGPYTVTVTPRLTLTPFQHPVDQAPTVNTVKGGSTVPLKFEVFSGGVELTDVAAIGATFTALSGSCTTGATDPVEVVTTGGTSLRYDTAGGTFVQNWQTPRTPGACLTVTLRLADGSSQTALFKLR